jgi:aspartate/methionine/tyrosine aminotransferase
VSELPPFAIERYFGQYEFSVPYLLCASDVEAPSLRELLALADDETRALWDGLVLGYTEPLGSPLLRHEIAQIYDTLEADDVIAVVGASEALFLLVSALVGPGDHVVALWPAYQSLYDLARSRGADVELVRLRPENDWALELDAIAAALRPNTKAVIVNLPHNPTGMHVGADEFAALVALVEDAGATLICDEVYRGLEHDPADRLPAAADSSPSAVSVGVLSKSYALAGLRVGWVATHDRELLEAMSLVRDYTTLCSPAPSEVLGVIALRAADALLERSRGIIAANLPLLDELMADHADLLEWVRPSASSIGFPRYRGSEGIDAFSERLAREQGVLLLPGSVYDYGDGYFRVGFGRSNLPEAVARLDRQLRS